MLAVQVTMLKHPTTKLQAHHNQNKAPKKTFYYPNTTKFLQKQPQQKPNKHKHRQRQKREEGVVGHPQLPVLGLSLGNGFERVLQEVKAGASDVRVVVYVPVQRGYVEFEELAIRGLHLPPQRLRVVVLEVPLSHREVGDDVAEFVDFLVALHHSGNGWWVL